MEACMGLGRSQRNLNKQQQKNLKLQNQQHTQLQQQKQQTQAIITNQNYYTIQHQPQHHPVARGHTTHVGALKSELQQQQLNEESHLVTLQQQQKNVQHNATPTSCTTTTTANMRQPSLSTTNDFPDDVGSVVQQQPQSQTTLFQKNTVTVEVTPMLPSTLSPTNIPGIVTDENVKTFRKINRQAQQHQQQQHQFQQLQHHHLLHQQQLQQLEADLDAIDVYVDPEPHVSFKGGGGLLRQNKTLGRLNKQHQHHHSIEDQHGQWTDTTSLQLLRLQQQQQHDYSYAYYEPGAVMRHTNIPQTDLMAGANEEGDLSPPPPNSIRALLLKGKKNKLLVSPTTQQSYQIRLTHQQSHNAAGAMASANSSNISTPENYYEEISASSTSSSSNSMTSPHQRIASFHSNGALTQTVVEEELRRVQDRHYKTLGELNLCVEAMLMPESSPNSGPTVKQLPMPAVSVTTASGQSLRLTSSSADNIYDTALMGGPDFISPIPNSAMVSVGLLQSSCVAADVDSGFSGSSGASYIGSLRQHKTKALMRSRSNKLSTTTTAAAEGNAAAKSPQSAFAYATQCCLSFQRANSNNTNATATCASAASSSAAVPSSATTSSCTIKHLPQIQHNTKQQQQRLHLQHQPHQHHDPRLHHHHHHLHQEQQHPHQQHQQSQHINDVVQSSLGFFTRASCGCRILNCTKIRAAEHPGPVVPNTQPIEAKARSFWKRKGWRKASDFSTSSIHDAG